MTQTLGKPGPFQIIDSDDKGSVNPVAAPKRRYSCSNYNTCLNLAGALDWDNFTCRGCNGEVDQSHLWRARHAVRNEQDMKRIFSFPTVGVTSTFETTTLNNTAQHSDISRSEHANLFGHYVQMLDEAKTGSE